MADETTSNTTTTTPGASLPAETPAPTVASSTIPGASADLGALFAALAQAQGEIFLARASSVGVVGKDDSRRTFAYADLAAVWEACRSALSKAGLAVLQRARVRDSWVIVETVLGHSSGQWIRSELTLLSCGANGAPDNRPRSIGATISFGRRYGLATLVGVAPADEEPEQTQQQQRGGRQDQRHQQQRQQQQAKPAPKSSAQDQKPAASEPDFDPETGVVREAGAPDELERQLKALDVCATAPELDLWSKRIAELNFPAEQLEQLRRALRAKRVSLATSAA